MASAASTLKTQKIVLVGAGFLGSHIARALAQNTSNRIQLSSRNPRPVFDNLLRPREQPPRKGQSLLPSVTQKSLLAPVPADVTDTASLVNAFSDATVVISLVGLLSGTQEQFDKVQWKGVKNVVDAVRKVNGHPDGHIKKIIHISAIGADENSPIGYFRTKGLGERELLESFRQASDPSVTIIRPSLIFGPGDSFFNRFATLSRFLPFLPVFGGGVTRFQPVFVGDLANAVEIFAREDPKVAELYGRNTLVQAGGPDVFTYRELMQLVLKHTGRSRPIISLPYSLGMIQGRVFELLPDTIFTITRSQVEQLKLDNVVAGDLRAPSGAKELPLDELLHLFGTQEGKKLKSAEDILPQYI